MKNKKSVRTLLWRVGTVVVLLAIAAVMMVIGRGHTVYFDNKTAEYEGTTYEAAHKVVVNVNGEKIAKLSKKERGMAINIGQKFSFELVVTKEKGGDEVTYNYTMQLPYGMDGIILNIPELLEGLPEEAYMTEFIPAPEEETAEDEELPTDEMEMPADF